jgi:hypothetical protein
MCVCVCVCVLHTIDPEQIIDHTQLSMEQNMDYTKSLFIHVAE